MELYSLEIYGEKRLLLYRLNFFADFRLICPGLLKEPAVLVCTV